MPTTTFQVGDRVRVSEPRHPDHGKEFTVIGLRDSGILPVVCSEDPSGPFFQSYEPQWLAAAEETEDEVVDRILREYEEEV